MSNRMQAGLLIALVVPAVGLSLLATGCRVIVHHDDGHRATARSHTTTTTSTTTAQRWVYYPDDNVYYCADTGMYAHHDNGRWVELRQRPHRHAYIGGVTISYTGRSPWMNNRDHIERHGHRGGIRGVHFYDD